MPKTFPIWLLCYPSFNICRIFYFLTTKCGYESCISSLSGLDDELVNCMIILFTTPFVYIFLGIYLYEVIPQQFGVRKHPLFCIKGLFGSGKKRVITSDMIDPENNIKISSDDEISAEELKVSEIDKDDRRKYPLIIDHLTKIYTASSSKVKQKKALKELNLVLNTNEIFGLLGPNGAGKTTFFSLLTGLYEPTSGNAWVCGNSIKEDIVRVQEMIGYCPQFDLLWADLSVEEHLYFYSRLKNVPKEQIRSVFTIYIL